LIGEGKDSTFDFAFADADKHNYDAYYELALTLGASAVTIAIDTRWSGALSPRPAVPGRRHPLPLRALSHKTSSGRARTLSLLRLSATA